MDEARADRNERLVRAVLDEVVADLALRSCHEMPLSRIAVHGGTSRALKTKARPSERAAMPSTQNLVVLVRLCGNVLSVVRNGEAVRVRKIGVYVTKPPSQAAVLELLRAP